MIKQNVFEQLAETLAEIAAVGFINEAEGHVKAVAVFMEDLTKGSANIMERYDSIKCLDCKSNTECKARVVELLDLSRQAATVLDAWLNVYSASEKVKEGIHGR